MIKLNKWYLAATILVISNSAFASLPVPVPEPGSASLIGAAAIAVVILKRFMKK